MGAEMMNFLSGIEVDRHRMRNRILDPDNLRDCEEYRGNRYQPDVLDIANSKTYAAPQSSKSWTLTE